VKFFTPKLFQSGVAYDKEWFLYPKAYANSDIEISMAERELLMSACNIENASGQLYFNYSIQCQVATPKLLAMIQHEETIQKLTPGTKIFIPKERLLAVLNAIPDKEIEFKTINLCLPVQLKGIKQALPKSLRKFDLKAIENLVRDWMRGQGTGFNYALITVILVLVAIIVPVILHFV
jgi:predicted nucleotidyltransferase